MNCRIYTLHKHARWNYRQIGIELWIGKSRVHKVVNRRDLQDGHVEGAHCLGHPWKVTKLKRMRVQEVIDQNPKLTLREITNVANVELCSTSI